MSRSHFALSCLLVLTATLGPFTHTALADELLVSSSGSSEVKRYDASSGAFLGNLASGIFGPSGLAIGSGGSSGSGSSDDSLYVGISGEDRVVRLNATTGAFLGGITGISIPAGLTLNDQYLFVSSAGDATINRIDRFTMTSMGSFVTAGSGGLRSPGGITIGPDGNLYVNSLDLSTSAGVIKKYSSLTGSYLGDFVPATGGIFGNLDLAFGPDGNLYVTSGNTSATASIRRFNGVTGAFIDNFISAGSGSGGLGQPGGLTFSNGTLYVSDLVNNQVKRYSAATGAYEGDLVGTGGGGLSSPLYLVVRPSAVTAAPEPGSLALLLPVMSVPSILGLLGRRRRKQNVSVV